MAGDFLEEDLAIFFDTDDFADTCSWKGKSIDGQFFSEPYNWDGVETVIDRFEAPAFDLTGIRQGDTMQINGSSYEVGTFRVISGIMIVRFK